MQGFRVNSKIFPETTNVIENRESGVERPSLYRETGIVARLVMTGLLTVALLGAIRWAADVTNANAKRVSRNLTRIQTAMDARAAAQAGEPDKNKKQGGKPDAK